MDKIYLGPIPKPQLGCTNCEPNCEICVQADQCNMNSRFMNKYCRRSCQLCQSIKSNSFKGMFLFRMSNKHAVKTMKRNTIYIFNSFKPMFHSYTL